MEEKGLTLRLVSRLLAGSGGWFFLAWAVTEIGTSLRSRHLLRRWQERVARAQAEERAKAARLAALGYGPSRSGSCP